MPMSARITNFAGGIVAEKRGGARQAFRHDPLGSTIAVISDAGTTTATYNYWPYGEVSSSTGSATTPWKFCGRWGYYEGKDTTTYVRARVLKRDLARWMTVDPLWPEELAYGYGGSSPVSRTDPRGMQSKRPQLGSLECDDPNDPRWGRRIGDAIPGYWKMVKDAILKDDCCQALIAKGKPGHDSPFPGLDGLAEAIHMALGERWLRRAVFCMNCMETHFDKKKCRGPHGGGSTATGVFGILDGTWRDYGFGDRLDLEDQIRFGVHMLCVFLCKRNGGCKCSDKNAIARDEKGRPMPPFPNPWPGNRWPYMPGGTDSDRKKEIFENCMTAGGLAFELPFMERKK